MSADEFGGLGFAPGVIRGVRSFDVDKFGRLTGIHYKQVWKPGENEAECRKNEDSSAWMLNLNAISYYSSTPSAVAATNDRKSRGFFGGRVPQSDTVSQVQEAIATTPAHDYSTCRCGFYGYFDGSDDYHDNARVTAVVEAYGEVVIGTRGFRAMKARIVALRIKDGEDGITSHVARKVTNNYKGVAIFDSFESMVSAFPPDTALEPSPDTDPNFWDR